MNQTGVTSTGSRRQARKKRSFISIMPVSLRRGDRWQYAGACRAKYNDDLLYHAIHSPDQKNWQVHPSHIQLRILDFANQMNTAAIGEYRHIACRYEYVHSSCPDA